MRRAPQWYQLAPSRLERELRYLAAVPYFDLDRTYEDTVGWFTALGSLHFTGRRSGKRHTMRCRLEYPRQFPKTPQHVFDHDEIFVPGADGHLFSNHELCLTLPEREEFSLRTEDLTQQVLGAALVWFHKRLLYERGRLWPGAAERHGIGAVIDLLVERDIARDAAQLTAWLEANAATPSGRVCQHNPYAPCPCGSGKALRFCHSAELKPLFNRLAPFHRERLKDILDLKTEAPHG